MKKSGLFLLISIFVVGLCGCSTIEQKPQTVTPTTEIIEKTDTVEKTINTVDKNYTVWDKKSDTTETYTTTQLNEKNILKAFNSNDIKAFIEEKLGNKINDTSYTLLEYRDFPQNIILDISLDNTLLTELLSEIIEGKPYRCEESNKLDYETNLPICKIVTDKYDYEVTYQPDTEYKIIRILNMQTDCSWYFGENTIEDRKLYWETVEKGCGCGCVDEEHPDCDCEEEVGC